MSINVRTVPMAVVLMVLAILSYSAGALLTGAWGFVPPAIIACGATFCAFGTDSKFVRVASALLLAVTVGLMLFMALLVGGLSAESTVAVLGLR